MISIPIPIVWKHITTLSTPLGLFVIWIGLCGPVPCPYVMYIDENLDACFLVTMKGPISIPAQQLAISDQENKNLIDVLPSVKNIFKVDISNIMGNSQQTINDPDDPKNVIDTLKKKTKAAIDALDMSDFSFGLTPDEVKRLNTSLRNLPVDMVIVNKALSKITAYIDSKMDNNVHLQSLSFPSNPKKLITPLLGPQEFISSLGKLLDAGADLATLGLSTGIISARKEVSTSLKRLMSSSNIQNSFNDLDKRINNFETSISPSIKGAQSSVLARAKFLKQAITTMIHEVVKTVTPATLGFIAGLTVPFISPIPCYGASNIVPVPPAIASIVSVVKSIPSILAALSDQQLIGYISSFVDLTTNLPRMNDISHYLVNIITLIVPDISYPDIDKVKLSKELIKTSAQNFFKLKIRMPHPGAIPVQITESQIKSVIKNSLLSSISSSFSTLAQELFIASSNNDMLRVLAVSTIIKGMFGSNLESITGNDVKSFLSSFLDNIYHAFGTFTSIIDNPSLNIVSDFKSIKETLFPSLKLPDSQSGPKFELNTKQVLAITQPLLQVLADTPIPFPVVLLGCSNPISRLALTKIHPYQAIEKLPSWEKLSTDNLPFMIWLDQLVATAQRTGGLGSDYVLPYFSPDL